MKNNTVTENKKSIIERSFFNTDIPTGIRLLALVALLIGLYFLITFVALMILNYTIGEIFSLNLIIVFVYHIIISLLIIISMPYFFRGRRWAREVYSLIFLSFIGYSLFIGYTDVIYFFLSYVFFMVGAGGVIYLFGSRSAVVYFGGRQKNSLISK